MVVTGQPKNTAEYLQATGRIGRDPERPGLVVTLYNWARPRDLAHYEHFEHYHATAAMQVEALSVTPYARRALDRELAGTFVATVRNLDERYSCNRDAHDLPLDGDLVRTVRERMRRRASLASAGASFDGGALPRGESPGTAGRMGPAARRARLPTRLPDRQDRNREHHRLARPARAR